MICVLNDHSHSLPWSEQAVARDMMAGLVAVLREVRGLARRVVVTLSRSIETTPLCAGYMIQAWLNDSSVDQVARQFWLQLATKNSYLEDVAADSLAMEAELNGRGSLASVVCFLRSGLLVSFDSDPHWETTQLRVEMCELTEEGEIASFEVALPHAATLPAVSSHAGLLVRSRPLPCDGMDLWSNRADFFPYLEFCDRVEEQIDGWGGRDPRFVQVVKKLRELDDYFESADVFSPAALRNCSPESEGTLSAFRTEHTFQTPSGSSELFSWHVRYTPGAGRIFFLPQCNRRRAIIGHLGEKLPNVSY